MPSKVLLVASVAAAVLSFSGPTPLLSQTPYRVLDHWKVGGTGGWDYLQADPDAHRLFITHGPRVEVIDTRSGKPVGAVTGLKGTHGVVLDPNGKVGYISDGQANDVAIFDRSTLAIIATVPTGTNPDGMTWEPKTKSVWAFNGRSNSVSVIDAASRSVVATTSLPGKPEFPQADDDGNVFVNIEDKNEIVRLGAANHTITAVWRLEGCDSPSGLALDKVDHRLFAVCDGSAMAVIDSRSGKQLATAKIGSGPDAAGYNAKEQLAFSSNGEGTLSVVDAAHGFKTVQSLATEKGARTMTYDGTADRIYLVTAEFGPRPEATAASPRPRPSIVPDSFTVLVIGR